MPGEAPANKATVIVDTGGTPLDADTRELLTAILPDHEIVEGPVRACATCGYFACVCEVRKIHQAACRYRTAMACPVSIHCNHGYDVCPECDPCTCEGP